MRLVFYILILAGGILTGCSEGFLDTSPYDKITTSNMWTTEESADKGINGIFNVFRNNNVSNTTGGLLEIALMEGSGFTSQFYKNNFTYKFLTGDVTPDYQIIENTWRRHYEGIHRSNDAIANLDKAPLSEEKYNRLLSEATFMRAYFYFRLNRIYQGVPIYDVPISNEEAIKSQSSAEDVWDFCIDDLTFCIENPHFPDANVSGELYGRPSKATALALRGMIYIWRKDYEKAIADLSQVENLGHNLFMGEYGDLFTRNNEQNPEFIFTIQFDSEAGYGDNLQKIIGGRDHYDGWTELQPAPDFVDYYQNKDGSNFSWEEIFNDWGTLSYNEREVFFLRDSLQTSSIPEKKSAYESAKTRIGVDVIDKYYLNIGNEDRIMQAYSNRDPRLNQSVITPYDTLDAYSPYYNNAEMQYAKVLRWPMIIRGADGGDMWSDKRGTLFYMYEKYNVTRKGELIDRQHYDIDYPLIRISDVLLLQAEAHAELGNIDDAISIVNRIRSRAYMPELTNGGTGPNAVQGQQDMIERVRYERRVEFCLEGVNYYDEVRWGMENYKEMKFNGGIDAGRKSAWGDPSTEMWYWADRIWPWPVPTREVQMNENLIKTPGWLY
ncbi:MAG TPA: RagB/SusD family nutrient uptake outer membrane protein [Mariniphaga sp.]|nr:RagB/SusD family nutrient uptake outer membrane protein [Mariniphaga sp.]